MVSANFPSKIHEIGQLIWLGIRRHLSIGITVLLVMLFSLPIILLLLPIESTDSIILTGIFRYLTAIPILVTSVVASMLSAGMKFSYLHQKTALDVFHAIPVRRPALFAGNFISGYLVVFIPQLLAFAGVIALRIHPGYRTIDLNLIISTGLSMMLITLAVYALSVLVFVITGNRFDACILLILINMAWPGTLLAIDTTVSKILPGFDLYNYTSLTNFSRYMILSPVGELVKVALQSLHFWEVVWWIALILIMIAASVLIVVKRPSEMAGRQLAYKAPFAVMRFLASLIAGLVLGTLYFNLYESVVAFMLIASLGSLIAHTLIEVILSRGFRNFRKSLISYAVFLVIFVACCVSVSSGFFGFDTYVPEADDVRQVQLSANVDMIFYNDADTYLKLNDPANIDRLVAMNGLWLEKMRTLIPKPYSLNTNEKLQMLTGNEPSRIIYELKSGARITRTVYFDMSDPSFAGLFEQIQSTEEYKKLRYSAYFEDSARLKTLILENKRFEQVLKLDDEVEHELLADILSAIKKDLLNNADRQDNKRFLGYIHLQLYMDFETGYSSGYTQLELTDAFTNTLEALKDYNVIDLLYSLPDDILVAYRIPIRDLISNQQLSITDIRLYGTGLFNSSWIETTFSDKALSKKIEKITDQNQIYTLYYASQSFKLADEEGYVVIFAKSYKLTNDSYINNNLLIFYLSSR